MPTYRGFLLARVVWSRMLRYLISSVLHLRSGMGHGRGIKRRYRRFHREAALGRTFPFPGEGGKVRNRRIFLVAAPFSEGLLTEATAAAQHRLQEPLFMPHSGPSPTPPGLAQEGGKARFHRRGRVDAVAPKRSISAEVRRWVGDCGMCICLACGDHPRRARRARQREHRMATLA